MSNGWHGFINRKPIRRIRGATALIEDAARTVVVPVSKRAHQPVVLATVVLLVAVGTLVRVASHDPKAAAAANTPQVFNVGGSGTIQTNGRVGPAVKPLRTRYSADVLVISTKPMSDAQIATARKAAGNGPSLLFSLGKVKIGKGATQAIGVDPGTFRSFAPRGTAESTPLWESIAAGDVAVAHTVARALAVPLGGQAIVGDAFTREILRVGAYATTGLPGIGVVVDQSHNAALGLVRRTGLILTARGVDSAVAASLVREALPGFTVAAVHLPLSGDGRLAWVPPALGRLTSGFGPRDGRFHEGLDFGANYGAPIYAAADGYVLYAGPASGFGNEVVLQHSGGVVTVYGHMERILVGYGFVKAGTAIALVGSEGDSTGPHLHFEVHLNDRPVDPYVWLVEHGVKFG